MEKIKKISETLKRKGIKPPRPPREALCRGEKHRWWKGGISPINEIIKKSPEYKLWRKAVFDRTTDTYGKNIWGNEISVEDIQKLVDANEKLVKELKYAKD